MPLGSPVNLHCATFGIAALKAAVRSPCMALKRKYLRNESPAALFEGAVQPLVYFAMKRETSAGFTRSIRIRPAENRWRRKARTRCIRTLHVVGRRPHTCFK